MSRSGAGDHTGLVADPRLRTSACPGVCSDIRIRTSRGIYSSLCSPRRVAARATFRRSGAGHPNGLIAGPRLRTNVCRGVCSGIRVRSGIYNTPGICPGLCSPR
jgi:hypothetical protein